MSIAPQPSNRLYVGNVDFRMSRQDVWNMFSEVGEVTDVFFPKNFDNPKRPHRGYVFVEMATPEEAITAIEEFHGVEDDYGRELIVRIADLRKEQPCRQ